jgi:hypothetical protein
MTDNMSQHCPNCEAQAKRVKALEEELIEARAEIIYSGWRDLCGWVPWQAGGNSLKQDEARRTARSLMENAK